MKTLTVGMAAVTLTFLIAATPVPLPPLDAEARAWVEKILGNLTPNEKIGQLIVAGTPTRFTNAASKRFSEIEEDLVRYHVGGYHAFRGGVLSAAYLIRRMQNLARVPLFITADLEGGAGLIFEGATRFPRPMALAATRDTSLVRQVAEITAREGKAIGVGINFSPVADVNNNPDNPIINIRSFGEVPEQVGEMLTAYIAGLRDGGLLSTAKHFPGHGDTSVDSHLELPTIPAGLERLQAVEFPPFRAAVAAGVDLIMAAHIEIPALETRLGKPASLSKTILTDLLREDFGFEGLIVTDALTMGGLGSGGESVAELTADAFEAGADLLLYPPSVASTYRVIQTRFEQGRITPERLDASVRRILEAKARLGLHKASESNLVDLDLLVGRQEYQELADRVMESAVTLVRDERNILPLQLAREKQVLLLTLLDEKRPSESRGDTFVREFRQRHSRMLHYEIDPDTSGKEIRFVQSVSRMADAVVVAGFIRIAAGKGSVQLSERQLTLLEDLSAGRKPLIFTLLGSPYLLRAVPDLPIYILTYDDYPGAETAAVKAIFGEVKFRGKLPVGLAGLYPAGHGLSR